MEMSSHVSTEPPAPSAGVVTAARQHLTSRHAEGVSRLFWDLEQRHMPDAEAVRAVLSAARGGAPAEALDVGAALVVLQAMRLELDLLEADVLDTAQAGGVPAAAVAAVLELPGAAAAEARHQALRAKRELPLAAGQPSGPSGNGAAPKEPAAPAGRRKRLPTATRVTAGHGPAEFSRER
jgi:hypothetical protein